MKQFTTCLLVCLSIALKAQATFTGCYETNTHLFPDSTFTMNLTQSHDTIYGTAEYRLLNSVPDAVVLRTRSVAGYQVSASRAVLSFVIMNADGSYTADTGFTLDIDSEGYCTLKFVKDKKCYPRTAFVEKYKCE